MCEHLPGTSYPRHCRVEFELDVRTFRHRLAHSLADTPSPAQSTCWCPGQSRGRGTAGGRAVVVGGGRGGATVAPEEGTCIRACESASLLRADARHLAERNSRDGRRSPLRNSPGTGERPARHEWSVLALTVYSVSGAQFPIQAIGSGHIDFYFQPDALHGVCGT